MPCYLSFNNSLLNPLLAPEKKEFPDSLLDDGGGGVATSQPVFDLSLECNHLLSVLQIPSPLLPRSHPSLREEKTISIHASQIIVIIQSN